MRRTDKLLFDIAQAAKNISAFTDGMDRDSFDADTKTRASVLYEIMIIGEAVKLLPADWIAQHPTIPWVAIARMRDQVIHRYFRVDLDLVWRVVMENAPSLYEYLLPIVTPLLADGDEI
jgi:uncharacterized protein with HEPN domain